MDDKLRGSYAGQEPILPPKDDPVPPASVGRMTMTIEHEIVMSPETLDRIREHARERGIDDSAALASLVEIGRSVIWMVDSHIMEVSR